MNYRQIDVIENGEKSLWLKVDSNATYRVIATICDPASSLIGQHVCNVELDGRAVVSFDSYGNTHEPYTRYVGCVQLQKGWYEFKLNHVKPGMRVDRVLFKK